MKVLKFDEWLVESNLVLNEDKGVHDYGCAMIFFDFPEIKDIHTKIDEADIYTKDDSDRAFGLEKDSHVTLLYGLHSKEIEDKTIIGICESEIISNLILYNVSTFENEDYDVLKFDVRYPTKGGSFLHKINNKLTKLPHTNGFPDYHPHSTIAYVKSGTGKKYVEYFKDLEFEVKPTKIVYSKPDGSIVEKTIK